jgi:very-short-patch-repair endonuclease
VPQTPHHRPTAKRIRNFAKAMRREPTEAELAMWRLLRDRRLALFKFRRQVPFQNFILDFVCFERRIIIEIDGSQHAASERDATREAALLAEGFRIERYWNNDVLQQPLAVLEDILAKLVESREPLTRRRTSFGATLSHKGRGKKDRIAPGNDGKS